MSRHDLRAHITRRLEIAVDERREPQRLLPRLAEGVLAGLDLAGQRRLRGGERLGRQVRHLTEELVRRRLRHRGERADVGVVRGDEPVERCRRQRPELRVRIVGDEESPRPAAASSCACATARRLAVELVRRGHAGHVRTTHDANRCTMSRSNVV
jgi:hypothetical protein